jgi:hypothetical protein
MAYQRVLLKLSGEALMGEQGYGIDPAIVSAIAADVASVVALSWRLWSVAATSFEVLKALPRVWSAPRPIMSACWRR